MPPSNPFTPTTALSQDPVAERAWVMPTATGVRMPQAWTPPLGLGQDDGEPPDFMPAPPISEQARDKWYQAATAAAPPPEPAPAPPPTPAPVTPSAQVPVAAAPPPRAPHPPQGGGVSTQPADQSFATSGPASTVAVSGAQDIGGDWKRGLATIGQMANQLGFDNEGAQAAMAIARTEAGLFGAVGDSGQSFGPYQFYKGGQLANYARDRGMTPDQAGEYARSHPWDAVQWALNGYLGSAIKKGQQLGLRGRDLATYAQRVGQVSVSPERAGQWYDTLFSGSAPGDAGPSGARAGGVAPAPSAGAGAPPATTLSPAIGGPNPYQPTSAPHAQSSVAQTMLNPVAWFTYADHGKEVLLLEGQDGQMQYFEVGETDQSDGTVIDAGTLNAQGQPGEGVGRGQDVGVGDDWYSDPTVTSQVIPQIYQQDDTARGLADIQDVKESQGIPVAGPQPVAQPQTSAYDINTPPNLSPTAVLGGYQKVGATPPQRVLNQASEQFAQTQTPESFAATAPQQQPETLPSTNVEGQPIQVPNVTTPPDNPIQRYQDITTGAAQTLLPTQAQAVPGVTGAVSMALAPDTWALGGAELAGKAASTIFRAGSGAAKVGSEMWPRALMSAAVVQKGVEQAVPRVPGAVADIAKEAPGAVASTVKQAPAALASTARDLGAAHSAALAAASRSEAQIAPQFAARFAAGNITGGIEAAIHTSPDDPNRPAKIAAASLATGLGFIALPVLLDPVARYANSYLAPAKNLPEVVQHVIEDYANMRNGALMRGYTYALEANRALGKAGDASAWNHLQTAVRYEADPALATDPTVPQPVRDFLSKTEQMVEATRQMGAQHGYIGGDVRQRFGVSRYFPRVYKDLIDGAKQRARSSGFSPLDFFSQEREIPTLADPEAQALNPLDSFAEPMSWYLTHVWDSEAKYQFIENLKTLKTAGVDVIDNAGKGPKDWVWGGQFSPRFQAYDFHPDLAKVIGNMHAPSAIRRDPVVQGAMRAWATLKDAMLSTSGFHFATELNQITAALPIERRPLAVGEVLMRTLQHSLIPGAQRNWELKNLDLMVDAANDGLQVMPGHLAAEAMPTINGQTGMLTGPSGMVARGLGAGVPMGVAQYQRETSQGTPSDQALLDAALWGAGAAAWGATGGKVLRDMLWNKGVPSAKLMTYGLLRDKYGGKVAAEFANEVFGGQNLAAIARSRTVQDALRAGTFAADWQEGWVRQMSNAFKGGPLGNLNRQYWARATVLGAFMLEGLNLAFNGHGTDKNADGNQFRLKMTGLYDHMGWPHTDDRGRNYDPYMDLLGPYRSFAELGQWALQQAGVPGVQGTGGGKGQILGMNSLGGQPFDLPPTGLMTTPLPDSPTNLAKYIDARLGPLPSLLITAVQNRDWRGQPIAQPNDPPYVAVGKWAAEALGNYAPVGPADVSQLVGSKEGVGTAAFSALTGRRITHVTPGAEAFRQRDKLFAQAGISQDQYARDQEMYSNLIAQTYADQKKIIDNPNLTPAQRLIQIDKTRIPSRPTWTAAELLDKVPDETDRQNIAKQLAQYIPGVQGSTAPADLDSGIDVGSLSDRYWSAGKDAANSSQQNILRQKELAKMATETGADQLALRDAVYWRARHPDGTPLPASGVPSAEIDAWVNQWKDAQPDDPTDPTSLSDARWQALKSISENSGLSEDAVWARIKTRMSPTDAQLSPNEAQIEGAFDALTTANPERFPKYVGPDGKPLQGVDPANADRILQGATTQQKKADPQVRQLVAAQEQGKSARLGYLLLQSPHKDDYERVFGLGRNMTDREWQAYTTNAAAHYTDKPTEAEAQRRDLVLRMYRAATPTQRRTVDVQATIGGQQRTVKLGFAYRDYEHLFDKKWRDKVGDALPDPEEEANQPQQ